MKRPSFSRRGSDKSGSHRSYPISPVHQPSHRHNTLEVSPEYSPPPEIITGRTAVEYHHKNISNDDDEEALVLCGYEDGLTYSIPDQRITTQAGKENSSLSHENQQDNPQTVSFQNDGDIAGTIVPFHHDDHERETWGKKMDFLLSVIGFAVDLANVWRFPTMCYQNGGGAFLIPYVTMLLIGGLPLFYMELCLGQYYRKGAITTWGRICPLFKGIGVCVVMIAFYVDLYYNVIISWALYYFFASFTATLPWMNCNPEWATSDCVNRFEPNSSFLLSNTSRTPADEYFDRGMLQMQDSKGFNDLGSIKWQLVLCLTAVYVICYFSLWKGISTSGKVVWFTAIFPYVVLVILLFRGITLDGAFTGIEYYVKPNITKLQEPRIWIDAATQVFFSLGPGFGVLMAFASYNRFNNNVYLDALATSSINCLTSFLAGFVVFAVLGHISYKTKVSIDDLAIDGPGLVFKVYPEAIAQMPGSTFWSLLFFMMLLTLGLDSSFGGSEAIITAIGDELPFLRKRRKAFIGGLFIFYLLIGLSACTFGGNYVVHWLDSFAAGYSIVAAVLLESIVVSWIYGVDRLSSDIEEMMGFQPGIYWRVCWKFAAPIFLTFNVVYGLIGWSPLTLGDYEYPIWANVLGWIIAASSIAAVPIFAIYQYYISPGQTFRQKLVNSLTPWKVTRMQAMALNNSNVSALTTTSIVPPGGFTEINLIKTNLKQTDPVEVYSNMKMANDPKELERNRYAACRNVQQIKHRRNHPETPDSGVGSSNLAASTIINKNTSSYPSHRQPGYQTQNVHEENSHDQENSVMSVASTKDSRQKMGRTTGEVEPLRDNYQIDSKISSPQDTSNDDINNNNPKLFHTPEGHIILQKSDSMVV